MSGEKKAAIEVQHTFIPTLSREMVFLIPPNLRELEMSRDGTDTLMEGGF